MSSCIAGHSGTGTGRLLPEGTQHSFLTGEEKGIDVRIALDVIALAHRREYDVAAVSGYYSAVKVLGL
ncbi:MAG: hypothetical protein OXT71_07495 [Acidobacteriota bacterium]|nr:hypothetical protein [Acidobacteriota bacterium]